MATVSTDENGVYGYGYTTSTQSGRRGAWQGGSKSGFWLFAGHTLRILLAHATRGSWSAAAAAAAVAMMAALAGPGDPMQSAMVVCYGAARRAEVASSGRSRAETALLKMSVVQMLCRSDGGE